MRDLFAAVAGLTAVVLATTAIADTPPPDAKPTLNASSGNNCAAQYYPPQAIRLNEQGSTTLNVHIDETGKVTDVDVTASSGYTDLDVAAKSCVANGWHFNPATQNGKPVASSKEYRIVWKLMSGDTPPRLQTPVETACKDIFSDAPNRWTEYRSATVQFRVSAKGETLRPFVAMPSGDQLFDAKAAQCVAHLKYSTPVVQGVPTEVPWSSAVRWSPHTGLAYTDGYKFGILCADNFFPANLWKGDPSGPAIISFHIVQGGTIANAAIERSSGNPGLDQGALSCIGGWRLSFSNTMDPSINLGEVVRVDWRDGHAYVLFDTWK